VLELKANTQFRHLALCTQTQLEYATRSAIISSMKIWTYNRPFTVEGIEGVVVNVATLAGELISTLRIGGHVVATDRFSPHGAKAIRNNLLRHTASDGRVIEVESGYVGWWTTHIAVRIDGRLVFESKPGATIAWPAMFGKMAEKNAAMTPEEEATQKAEETRQREQFKRNKPSLFFDIFIALLFFVVAKFTNLSTAALVSAGAGIIGWIVQRITKIDLMGGLATFGIVMSLVTAGYALAFQDEEMVKMRSTILGTLTALLFLTDGLFGGRFLGKRLVRFMPHPDTHPGRLAIGLGTVGLIMASLNYGIAKVFSTDVWLFYTTFGDTFLALALAFGAIKFAMPRGVSLTGSRR
jgi:intracellular septation protein A